MSKSTWMNKYVHHTNHAVICEKSNVLLTRVNWKKYISDALRTSEDFTIAVAL